MPSNSNNNNQNGPSGYPEFGLPRETSIGVDIVRNSASEVAAHYNPGHSYLARGMGNFSGVVIGGVDVIDAAKHGTWKDVVVQTAGVGGSLVGGAVGSALGLSGGGILGGLIAGPPGAAAGGVGLAIVGGTAGSYYGEDLTQMGMHAILNPPVQQFNNLLKEILRAVPEPADYYFSTNDTSFLSVEVPVDRNFVGTGSAAVNSVWNGTARGENPVARSSGNPNLTVSRDSKSGWVSVHNEKTGVTSTHIDHLDTWTSDWATSKSTKNNTAHATTNGGGGAGDGGKPIVIDLDGDGVEILPKDRNFVLFDFDDDGYRERTAWVGRDDGLLMFDENGDGRINSAREIAFSQWIAGEDLTDVEAARKYFDVNKDGRLNALDARLAATDLLVQNRVLSAGTAVWENFRIWQDADSDGVVDAGELKRLADLGIGKTPQCWGMSGAEIRV
jgi:hypothetical protein